MHDATSYPSPCDHATCSGNGEIPVDYIEGHGSGAPRSLARTQLQQRRTNHNIEHIIHGPLAGNTLALHTLMTNGFTDTPTEVLLTIS